VISRRTFIITAVGGLLGTSRSAGRQQTGKIARVGILLTGSPSNPQPTRELDAFTKELRQLGWVEGQNLAVERRWTETPDSFPGLAADLVRDNVSVILTPEPAATRAAKEATSTIPIVMIASTARRRLAPRALPGRVAISRD
jgi:putative ABC transport system substrate-binding protein